MKRNLINEIINKKYRYGLLYVSYPNYLVEDLKDLEKSFIQASNNHTHDVFSANYMPVSICSCIETFLRLEIANLINKSNFDPRKLDLLPELRDIKMGFAFVNDLVRKKISLGELAAHLVKINSIYSINRVFSSLLQTDFLKDLKAFKRNYKSDSYLKLVDYWSINHDQIVKDLQSVYELRNIACHEFGYSLNISQSVLERYLKNSITFLEVASLYLGTIDYIPLQKIKGANEASEAKQEFLKVEYELNALIDRVCEAANNVWFDTVYLTSDLRDEMILWKRHRKKVVIVIGEMLFASTPDRPMYWNNMEMLTAEKIDSLTKRYQYLFDEAESSLRIQSFE